MKQGFTLIELLVVISVIGILAAFAIASFSSAQARGRDVKRIADLDAIKKALALYQTNNGQYPVYTPWACSTVCGNTSWSDLETDLSPYIKKLPSDPKNDYSGNDPTFNTQVGYTYAYYASLNGETYDLIAFLENENSPNTCVNKGYLDSVYSFTNTTRYWCVNNLGNTPTFTDRRPELYTIEPSP